jgi:hypothetical protein
MADKEKKEPEAAEAKPKDAPEEKVAPKKGIAAIDLSTVKDFETVIRSIAETLKASIESDFLPKSPTIDELYTLVESKMPESLSLKYIKLVKLEGKVIPSVIIAPVIKESDVTLNLFIEEKKVDRDE